jgi:hypothetical protein
MLVGEGELSIPWKDGSPTTRGENNEQEQQATINQQRLLRSMKKNPRKDQRAAKKGRT